MTRPLLALCLVAAACEQDNTLLSTNPTVTAVAPGSIRGRVCDPTGRNWLADAIAYTNLTDDNGVVYDTRKAFSDLDGYFEISDLPGNKEYMVYVTWGAETLIEEPVIVPENQGVVMDEPDCFDPLSLDVAVVAGDYDDFGEVLTDMGFVNYKTVNGIDTDEIVDFFSAVENLTKYDIIFVNGGVVEDGVFYNVEDPDNPTPDVVMANVKTFVEGGGGLYASDWSYDVVEVGWPDKITFVGADAVRDDAQKGDYKLVQAAVQDANLAEYLGKQYVDIEFDLPVWPPIQNTADSVSVHLAGTVPYSDGLSSYTLASVPLLVSFNAGNGNVAFSTFRVVRNAGPDMYGVLQYMMYNL
jgi:hypothetical protein